MKIYRTLSQIRLRSIPESTTADSILGMFHDGVLVYGLGEEQGDWARVFGPLTDGRWELGWSARSFQGMKLLEEWSFPQGSFFGPLTPSHSPISQMFGENPEIYFKALGYRGHNGIDLGIPLGTPILSPVDAVVSHARFNPPGYGNYVRLDWDRSILICAHLSLLSVIEGQHVSKGQIIGRSGNSGMSTGSHLHLDYRLLPENSENGYGGRIDPLALMDFTMLGIPSYIPYEAAQILYKGG